MSTKSIVLENVSKIYNQKVTAMDNVNFKIEQGQFKVVMGQSGSGKSTFLQIAGLLDVQTSGKILINDKDMSTASEQELPKIRMENLGFVFQAFHLNPYMKAYENVMLPMLINEKFKNLAQIEKRAKELLELVGLDERMEHYSSELSGGEQQRVAIARALANDPDFILADEPTGNLDSKNEKIIFEVLKDLSKKGKGVLVVSHNDLAREYADKLYVMKDGVMTESNQWNLIDYYSLQKPQ